MSSQKDILAFLDSKFGKLDKQKKSDKKDKVKEKKEKPAPEGKVVA